MAEVIVVSLLSEILLFNCVLLCICKVHNRYICVRHINIHYKIENLNLLGLQPQGWKSLWMMAPTDEINENQIYRARYKEQALKAIQGIQHYQLGYYALERRHLLGLIHMDRLSRLEYCHVG